MRIVALSIWVRSLSISERVLAACEFAEVTALEFELAKDTKIRQGLYFQGSVEVK